MSNQGVNVRYITCRGHAYSPANQLILKSSFEIAIWIYDTFGNSFDFIIFLRRVFDSGLIIFSPLNIFQIMLDDSI